MPTTTERAVKGHERSKLKLFESNKSYIYAFCDILLEDGKKAATAVESVMNEVWRSLPSSGISTDTEFRHLLTCVAAEHCRLLLFGRNSKSFKVSKTLKLELPELKEEAYNGVFGWNFRLAGNAQCIGTGAKVYFSVACRGELEL